MEKLSGVQDVDRCVDCHHHRKFFYLRDDFDPIARCWSEGEDGFCGCKCEFPFPSVSEAEDKNSGEAGRDLATQSTECLAAAETADGDEGLTPRVVNAPERIYLQLGVDNEVGDVDFNACSPADISWCNERIWETDVEYARSDSYNGLVTAAKAALEYVDNMNEDTPVDPNCKECVGRVFYTKGTPEPPLCWVHQLEKAVDK